RQLKLVAALRYDRLDYKFDNHLPSSAFTGAPDEKNHFEHWTPKLGLTYDFKKDRGIYLNYSTGFAPPNISELYAGVKVPTLKPAIYKNYEGGGWYAFAKKGYVEMNIYQMLGANEIVNVKLADGSYLNQNVGKTLHQGVEANIRYQVFEGLMVRAGGTLAKHEYIEYIEKGNDYSGNSMSQAPRYLSNSEITYRPAFLPGFRMGLEWQTMGRYFMDAQNTKEYEGFSVFNARAGYKRDKIEMWLNCINLTDAVYATTSDKSAYGVSYRPGQLRTFNVGIGYSLGKGN
ncbi:MAG: TonB-dependent receptor, partial [Cyclobacteriaceae bacterium]|nr:TonB-dependent receptor [Cyclobacteriaceae bacterium]